MQQNDGLTQNRTYRKQELMQLNADLEVRIAMLTHLTLTPFVPLRQSHNLRPFPIS
jgi:hypothetical protein